MSVTLPNNMKSLVGRADFLFLTLDTLRYDAAQKAFQGGRLQTLGSYLNPDGWECRHSPASFTYAAHHAFFSGFLPTPTTRGPHPRLFASKFALSETSVEETFVFEESTLPEALSNQGYRTICIGGTGFFNPQNSLGRVLPELFDEAHWSSELGVADRCSEKNQIDLAVERLQQSEQSPTLLFINLAAIHQPNWFYDSAIHQSEPDQQPSDTLNSHTEALVAVDLALTKLFDVYNNRNRPTFAIVCSDHGTAYGEEGYHGHRLAHEVVWNVPYAEFML